MTAARGRPIVMLVTSRARLAERVGARPNDLESVTPHLLSQIESAAMAGVSLIQLREPDLEAGPLTRLARAAMRVIDGSATKLVVNGRLDVALAAPTHGIHLPERGLPAGRARMLLPAPSVVGLSVHGPIGGAEATAVDYALFGAVYLTRSKSIDHRAAGVEALRRVVEGFAGPVLAIGGVTLDRVSALAAAGAAGIAAIGLFLPASGTSSGANLRRIVESVHEAFDTVRDVS